MKKLWRPTLVQRVFFAVLLAFAFVLVALQVYMYVDFRRSLSVDQGLSRLGRSLSASLADVHDPAQARAVMASTDRLYKTLRISGNPAGSTRLQLLDREGAVVYASPALAGQLLAGPVRQVVTRKIDGEPYWVYRSDSPQWSLRVAEPERTFSKVLKNNTRSVLPYLLLAFPIVLLPVWFAVKHGLQPLQRLADCIEGRGADDLSPLGVTPSYAELEPLASALERMLQQLRDKMGRERAFVQDAAHELRTPMAVIAAQAHALAGAGSSEERSHAQTQLEQAIGRASHLSRQLLALASLDDIHCAVGRTIDVAQFVRQIMAQAAPRALARGIDLSFDAPDSLTLKVDVAAFQSILENLIDNAIRYVQQGAQVVVTLSRGEHFLRLSVEDDGPGIALSERERIFERFFRGSGHDAPGSGLGLAIVRQAAARIGGDVRVCCGLRGRGAGFHIAFLSATEPAAP